MNWYRIIKFADSPLPSYEGVPEPEQRPISSGGISCMERLIDKEFAGEEKKTHPSLNYLGAGNYGIAYTGPGDVVIKYTSDLNEYESALKILKMQEELDDKNVPGVVTVFHVENFPEKRVAKIYLEKVSSLSGIEKRIIRKFDQIPKHLIKYYNFNDFMSAEENLTDSYHDVITSMTKLGIDIDINIIREVYKKYRTLLLDLASIDVSVWDLHPGNIGINHEGNYVVLDIGAIS